MKRTFVAVIVLASCGGRVGAPGLTPPIARKSPHSITLHGETRVDPYYWLRNRDAPEVIAHLEGENAYADSVLAPTEALRERLFEEIKGRIKQTDMSVPELFRGYYYAERTEDGKQYEIYTRRRGSLDAEEKVVLDVNALAEGKKFMAVGAFEVSDDGNLLAYSTDETGFRNYTLHVQDLRTGELLPETVEKVDSVAWAADNKTLLYAVEDGAKRTHRIYRHVLGQPVADDALVYEEPDERFNVQIEQSRSGKMLFMSSHSHTQTEVWFAPADDPTAEFVSIAGRDKDHEYYVDHRGDAFYILTNDAGRNFRVVTAPVASPGKDNWTELLPHSDTVMREELEVFADYYVVMERENGLPQVRVTDFASGDSHRIEFPEVVYSVSADANPEFDSPTFRLEYESFVTPASVYDYRVADRGLELLKREEVLGGYDPDAYESERIEATAPDGTKIPISLVARRGVPRDGTAPMLLLGYGSYGIPYPVSFSYSRVSLLDRGVVVAIGHVRGGGEMGKRWHDDGRMFHKMNTFTDFIAVADHLVTSKYAARDRLVIMGGSAGGLLMGVVANLRPDVAKAIVLDVPFVDVINTMLDDTLPLTIGEYEEWGNPNIADQYAYMKQYCPYSNIAAKDYPAMLVKTSYDDSQVMYWEPAKYVARMRELRTDHNPLLFKTNMAGGHGGSSGRYDRYKETAYDYAYILWQLGLADASVSE